MLKPVNRYILVEVPKPSENLQALSIVLPDDYKAEQESHATVSVLGVASDVRFDLSDASQIGVDRSMIEEINVGGTIYNIILDNYVIGIVD